MEVSEVIKDIYALKANELNGVRNYMLKAISRVELQDNTKRLLIEIVSRPGKMLRPLVLILAAGDYSKNVTEELSCAAAAAELLHISSLLHDDIIDRAEIRRGNPSVQSKYGIPTALCAGDSLLIMAFSFLNSMGYHETANELMEVALRVCDGEMLQDEYQYDTFISEDTYLKSIRGKTAASFVGSFGTGCRIANRPMYIRDALMRFGELMGLMFQIRDDILDWTQDAKILGKPVNEDFRNGIYTIPAIYAFNSENNGSVLRGFAEKKEFRESDFINIRKIVIESGGIDYAQSMMNRFAEQAIEQLNIVPQDQFTNLLFDLVSAIQHDL